MSSKPEHRRERYQEMHKGDFPTRDLRSAIKECKKSIAQARLNLRQPAAFCLRDHPRTPENLRSNGTCIPCERARYPHKTHCRNGLHPWASGGCILCRKASDKRGYDKVAAKQRALTAAKRTERNKVWVNTKTGKLVSQSRRADLQAHGWTQQMVEITLFEQGDVCALCRRPFTKKDHPCADHRHSKPPEPRGVIHASCNAAIGLLRENPEICRAAAEYLEAWCGD
jgi:Recombination endonuclease VII